jgi:hypothetical protein
MQLAQVNIARMLAPMDSPVMSDFVANLDPINRLAESSPGFIWRLKDDTNNATSIKVFDDEFIIINMSVWESVDSLFNYVYKSDHVRVFRRKPEWFEKMTEMHMALWFIEPGQYPTPQQAEERIIYLRENGETPYAFTFKKRFTVEDLAQGRIVQ